MTTAAEILDDEPTPSTITVPSIGDRLKRANQHIAIVQAAARGFESTAEQEDHELLEGMAKLLGDAMEELYWVRELSPRTLNLSAPDGDDRAEMERARPKIVRRGGAR